MKHGTRRSTTPLAATAALALATVGLAACSQPAVLEQPPAVRSEHVVPRDIVLLAASDPVIVLTETDTVRVTSTVGVSDTRASPIGARGLM